VSDPTEQFKAAMLNAGVTPPDVIEADGKRHRFDADGRKGKKTGWYTLHLDGTPAGNFGCWRTLPEGVNWCSKSRDSMTDGERQAHRQRIAALQAQREQEAKERQTEAKTECAKLWDVSRPCLDGEHPYLVKKGVKPYGLHVMGSGQALRLLVPMRVGPELVSLQFIDAAGQKRFKTGGQVQGAYCGIGKPQSQDATVIVCEGYATGASLFESTGQAVAVAFNAGNLIAVAQALRAKLPHAKIIVAADNDWARPATRV
jgi:putative DNA primase/helicase